MSEKFSSKCPPQALVNLSAEQIDQMKSVINQWEQSKGLVIGSLGELDGIYNIGFRQFPTEIGKQIIQIVNDYYKGETNVNS